MGRTLTGLGAAVLASLLWAPTAWAQGAFFAGASKDGSVTFFRTQEQLTADDTDSSTDIYRRSGGVTTRVSKGEINGNGPFPAIFDGVSKDGSVAFFHTQEQLTADDTDSSTDIYKRSGGVTSRVSKGEINGNGPWAAFFRGASADGSVAVFTSQEQLTPDDTEGDCPTTPVPDCRLDVYKRSGGVTSRASRGEINGNGPFHAFFEGVSADGSVVFFRTVEQLTADDTDIFLDVYKRSGGGTSRVSKGEINGNGPFTADFSGASKDGRVVFFRSREQLTTDDTDSFQDIFQRSAGTTTRVSKGEINGNGDFHAIFRGASANGSVAFFHTIEPLTADDTEGNCPATPDDCQQDIYKRSGAVTSRASRGEINGNGPFDAFLALGPGGKPAVSKDGSAVLFVTNEQLSAGDTDSEQDVYRRSGGVTRWVSQGEINGNGPFHTSFSGASADGSVVFIQTTEQLTSDDTDSFLDVYKRSGGVTRRVSRGEINGNGDFDAFLRGASADGSIAFFTTDEPLTPDDIEGDCPATPDDCVDDVYKRSGGVTRLMSKG